jgi:hypothetical protein
MSSHTYVGHSHYIHTEQWSLIHNTMYSVHDGFLCHVGGLVLLSSWFPHGSLVSSTIADQLLILPLTRWARPPSCPLPRVDHISLRVHAFTRSPVRYRSESPSLPVPCSKPTAPFETPPPLLPYPQCPPSCQHSMCIQTTLTCPIFFCRAQQCCKRIRVYHLWMEITLQKVFASWI